MRSKNCLTTILLMLLCLTACQKKQYHVGVSQCSGGIWREMMNNEILLTAALHDDVKTTIMMSSDDPAEQARQIEKLIDQKVDVLIIAPLNIDDLDEVIEKAHKANIHVVLVDRKTRSAHYDAFIGGNNFEVGAIAARRVAQEYPQLSRDKKVNIIEMQGDILSTPVQERHKGFVHTLEGLGLPHKSIGTTWLQDSTWALTDSLLQANDEHYLLFCHNDIIAKDVYIRAQETNQEQRFTLIGVDALYGQGITMIDDGWFTASVRYPSGGEEAMNVAISLIEGSAHYEHDILIQPFLVDRNNTEALKMEHEKIQSILDANNKLSDMLTVNRRTIAHLLPVIAITGVISAVLVLLIIYMVYVMRRNEQRHHDAEQQFEEYLKAHSKANVNIGTLESDGSDFMSRLSETLTAHLQNANATADDLAAHMHMGRSQFYHHVKEKTGYSPMEMLRIARLKQAAILLEKKELNIQEICYQVGFATPSYFAKCFKKHYGVSPSEYKAPTTSL